MCWPSHKDHARKALSKLAGPHLPATLKQVETAVAKAHAEHEQATIRAFRTSRSRADEIGEAEVVSAAIVERVDDDEMAAETQDSLEAEGIDDRLRDRDEMAEDVAGVIGFDRTDYSDADPGL